MSSYVLMKAHSPALRCSPTYSFMHAIYKTVTKNRWWIMTSIPTAYPYFRQITATADWFCFSCLRKTHDVMFLGAAIPECPCHQTKTNRPVKRPLRNIHKKPRQISPRIRWFIHDPIGIPGEGTLLGLGFDLTEKYGICVNITFRNHVMLQHSALF